MKALILNSGMGTRMGVLASEQPKCMTEVAPNETIISRQLIQLVNKGIDDVVITTGRFESCLVSYCNSLDLPIHIKYVFNPEYASTNYIYSIYCAREFLEDDILMMHGDLVFENDVLDSVVDSPVSCMVVSSAITLPDKDFKAVVKDNIIIAVGVEFFDDVVAAQPLYKLKKTDWDKWCAKIIEFCEANNKRVYAEQALNSLGGLAQIHPLDVKDKLCSEVDDEKDLEKVIKQLKNVKSRT